MYTAFFGLREKPFVLSPNPRYLFLSAAHREALAHLIYGVEQGEGFITITGEVGTGKTTLCRALLDRLGAETEIAYLFNPSRTGLELLQSISMEFSLPATGLTRRELLEQLNRFLLEKKRENRRVLLIVDEAQTLSSTTLEQIRLLSNLETASSKLIQILLLGQPELDTKLDSTGLRQLRQRISVRWTLKPMSAKETAAYVRHRLRVAAGGRRELFDDGALREIYRRTRGVPRLVNVLCDRSLLAAYGNGVPTVDAAQVRGAAREIPDARRGFDLRRRLGLWSGAAALACTALLGGWAAWSMLAPGTQASGVNAAAIENSPPAVSTPGATVPAVSAAASVPASGATASAAPEAKAAAANVATLAAGSDS